MRVALMSACGCQPDSPGRWRIECEVWRQPNGEPLVFCGARKVISLERQVRIAAGAIVFVGVRLAHFLEARFIWLSGLVSTGVVVAGITDFCGMGLLLAKMPWNRR